MKKKPEQKVDLADLALRIKKDRVNRRMSWPDYAAFRKIGQSTIYKIAMGTTNRPHETTLADIQVWLPSWADLDKAAKDKAAE